jgi:phospholipid/cholesterol/gamma-HCH transport system substrate-binding protein
MSERQQRFRLGVFVIICMGLLGVLVVVFGGAPSWFKPSNSYTILFADAPGIASGTPVRKSGVKVGEVSSIDLDNSTGQVRVVVRLEPNFAPRTGDEPTVTRGLLVGDTAIDFIPKSPDKPQRGDPIAAGATLQGISPFNARVLIDQATGIVPQAQKTLEQVRKSLEALEKVGPQMEATFKEVSELAKAGRDFIPELRKTNDNLRDFFADSGDIGPSLKTLVPEFKRTTEEIRYFLKTASFWIEEAGVTFKKHEPKLVKAVEAITTTAERIGETVNPENQKMINETLKNVRDASARFDRLGMQAEDLMKDGKTAMKSLNSTLGQAEQGISELRQMTKPLADQVPRILNSVETSTDQFNKAMADARELIRAIGRAEGSFQKIISDPTLYNNLVEATAMVTKLMPRLDRILKDVEVFADKIARHPESLGIGGAVRPSSGLKEAPSSGLKPHMP